MTNHWIDYRNADVFINLGGNTAENHPVSMKWIEHARKNRGAKLIVVDPRVSRTAAVADLYAPQRPGTNIAFINGMINYMLVNNLYHKEYVAAYTNATYLVNEGFSFDDVNGLFSGAADDPNRQAGPDGSNPFPGSKSYDTSTWQYQTDADGNILKDPDMEDPNCVLQLMKEHYSKYTVENVSQMTGCPEDTFREVCELYGSTGQPGKAGNFMYAMGITQFTHGAQGVRSIALLQLILGNIGIPGGGVNAQRGQSNVQGCCDMGILFHIVTGYMPVPRASHVNLEGYNATTPAGWWSNRPKYIASMLKAFYDDKATPANDFLFDYLPKLKYGDHSHIAIYDLIKRGEIRGMICWADNPAVSGPYAGTKREYQANLDWYVSVDVVANESADFWKAPDMNPADVKTEVFILPATTGYERDGTKTNSGRWVQWINATQKPPGECKSDLTIANEMFKAIRAEYEADSNAKFPGPILDMNWDYDDETRSDGVDIEKIDLEINGYTVADRKPVVNFTQLQDDGSTACGSWIYSGFYNNTEDPHCKRRIKEKEGIGSNSDFSWAWPVNRRIVYNRCGADPSGKPWNPDLPLIWWENGEWKRNDVPDFGWLADGEQIPPEVSAERPFIMLPEGQSRLFSFAMADGPFPTHYEPADSPVTNHLYPNATYNPISTRWYPPEEHTVVNDEERAQYPYIMTTYRVCEHYQTGSLTRNIPWLNEMMPELFVEIDEELAAEKGIKNGDKVKVSSKRTGDEKAITAKACVTQRLKPLEIQGEKRHIVGMPYHWGFSGLGKGDICNDLSPACGDANTTIPEYKAFVCNIEKAGDN